MGGLLKVLRKTPLLIAVPTTAGTGSETTLAAVITDPATHYKYPINDFALIPDAAVLDYHVTLGLPEADHRHNRHGCPDPRGGSLYRQVHHQADPRHGRVDEAVTLIAKYLLRAYRDGQDAEARTQMPSRL